MNIGDITFEGDLSVTPTINTSGTLDISTLLAKAVVIYATHVDVTTFTLDYAFLNLGQILIFKFPVASGSARHMDIVAQTLIGNELSFGGATFGDVASHKFQYRDVLVVHSDANTWNVLLWMSYSTWAPS